MEQSRAGLLRRICAGIAAAADLDALAIIGAAVATLADGGRGKRGGGSRRCWDDQGATRKGKLPKRFRREAMDKSAAEARGGMHAGGQAITGEDLDQEVGKCLR